MDNQRGNYRGADRGDDGALATGEIQVERKTFIFALKENARGAFLRITEDVGGRRDSIILPATGLEEFRDELNRMIEVLDSSGNQ